MGITMIVMSTRLDFLLRSLGFIERRIGESRLASYPGGISIASCGWSFVTIDPRFHLATVVGAIVYLDDFATVFTANTIEKVRLVSGSTFPRRKHTESHVPRWNCFPELWAHFFTELLHFPKIPGNYFSTLFHHGKPYINTGLLYPLKVGVLMLELYDLLGVHATHNPTTN